MRYVKGFTLIELLVALVVAAVILGLAVPSMRTMMANSSLRATTGELASALGAARMQALSMRADVSVSPAAGGWEDGWTIDYPAASAEQDKTFTPEDGVTVGREDAAGGLTFVAQGGVTGGGAEFSVCSADAQPVRGYTLELSFLGKVTQTEKGDCP
ncbi:MAG: GspH/FimT family pseudopilin [Pseudomonadaceae bacterium]